MLKLQQYITFRFMIIKNVNTQRILLFKAAFHLFGTQLLILVSLGLRSRYIANLHNRNKVQKYFNQTGIKLHSYMLCSK